MCVLGTTDDRRLRRSKYIGVSVVFSFFYDTGAPEIYPHSLLDARPILNQRIYIFADSQLKGESNPRMAHELFSEPTTAEFQLFSQEVNPNTKGFEP